MPLWQVASFCADAMRGDWTRGTNMPAWQVASFGAGVLLAHLFLWLLQPATAGSFVGRVPFCAASLIF
jgi:hypothetical protein